MAYFHMKLKPFTIPNFVILEIPESLKGTSPERIGLPDSSVPLKELDEGTLAQMCDDFREGVFAKAGKTDPRKGAIR